MVTGISSVKVLWLREPLEKSTAKGTIVAHFKQPTRPFKLFSNSLFSQRVLKSHKTLYPQCRGSYDSTVCHHEQRCKNASKQATVPA